MGGPKFREILGDKKNVTLGLEAHIPAGQSLNIRPKNVNVLKWCCKDPDQNRTETVSLL